MESSDTHDSPPQGSYFDFDIRQPLSGKPALFVRDEVATRSAYENEDAVQLQAPGASAPAIWVRDGEVAALRTRYPGTPLYGFWQAALFNSAVDLHRPLHIAYTGHERGLYLLCAEGKAVQSGSFSANQVLDSSEPVSAAHVLDPGDALRWRAPPIQARTMQEIVAQQERQRRNSLLRLVGGAAAILALTVGLNVVLSGIASTRAADIARASGLKTADQLKLDRLRVITNHGRFPDARSLLLLDRVTSVLYSVNDFRADISEKDLQGDYVRVVTALPFRNPGFPVNIALRQDGLYDVAVPITVTKEAAP